MTTDAEALAEVDAEARWRELRRQHLEQLRASGDGHGRNRRPAATMDELKKRARRRKTKRRVMEALR